MFKRNSKKSKSKSSEDTSWIVEGIVGYLRSPAWKSPVMNFIEEHCGIFIDCEENSFKHTEIHQNYKKLVEKQLSLYMKELGISEEQFSQACTFKNSDIPRHDSYFRYIWAADDYILFKRLMVKNNAEIQREAVAMYHGEVVGSVEQRPDMSEKDAEVITKMLKSSKTTISKENKLKKLEENDVKLAIQFSKMEMERLNSIVEEEKRLLEEAIRLSLEQSHQTSQSESITQPSQSDTSNHRPSPWVISHGLTMSAGSTHESLTQPVKVTKKYDLPEGFSAESLEKPASYEVSSQSTQTIAKIVDPSQSAQPEAVADLPIPEDKHKVKKDLPPLRSEKDLSSSEAASAWLTRAMEEITSAKPSESVTSKSNDLPEEELAKRKAYLQQQRNKLLALKRQEREKELSEYIEQKQAEVEPSPKEVDPEVEKKLAARRAVAERLKREVINKK